MGPLTRHIERTRRGFLASSAAGIGTVALADLLAADGLLAASASTATVAAGDDDPESAVARRSSTRSSTRSVTRRPHFAPRAKSCIFLFMAGAPSQLDLFDPKPRLRDFHHQPLPESFTKDVRFAFIDKRSAVIIASPRTFRRHGDCGTELSDLLPHLGGCVDDIALVRSLHSEQFNHHPGQLLMNTGSARFGLPSVGSWINYGLGSESSDLPGYVVLTAGRGSSGGTSNWQSGFLPSSYAGVLFRNRGEPVLHLDSPPGVRPDLQRLSLDAIVDLNRRRFGVVADPELESRIASYELAGRMQSSAPELIDLRGETRATLEMYGVDRADPPGGGRGAGPGVFAAYATNCLLARRLVERGVRFVGVHHASWDHHSNLDQELGYNAAMADQPVAALLRDLKQRGLMDTTLVVWGSEFGRTPLGENRGGREANTGRDHHPFGFSMWLAGGGIRGGRVLGATDELGWHAVEDRLHVNDFHATLLHLFGFDHTRLTYRFKGRDFRLTDVGGTVCEKLFV